MLNQESYRCRRPKLILSIIFFMAFFSLKSQTVFWQAISESYYVGDSFVASLVIDGTKVNSAPAIAGNDEFKVQFLEKKQVITEEQNTTIFRYKFIPLKKGSLSLPDVRINSLLVDRYSIKVKVPATNPNLNLSIDFSETSCYQFQPITLYFNWEVAIPLNNLKAVSIDLPIYKHANFKVYTPSKVTKYSKHDIGLPVSGKRVIASISDVTINNVDYKGLEFRLTVVPQKVGVFNIDPSTILCSYLKQNTSFNAYPAYFDNNLFDTESSNKYQRLVCQSKPMKLIVKELPKSNRPDNFSGLFGKFSADAHLSEPQVTAGESLKLQLDIRNYDYPETFILPKFNSLIKTKHQISFTDADPVQNYNDSLINLDKLIRIVDSGIAYLPVLNIPYFDLDTEQFGFISTDEVPIQVLPNTNNNSKVDSAEVINRKNAITTNPNGILQLYTKTDALNPQFVKSNYWFWIILIVLPLLIFIGNKVYAYYTNEAIVRRSRIKAALKVFNTSSLKQKQDIHFAIQRFFKDTFNLNDSIILPRDIELLCKQNCPDVNVTPMITFYKNFFENEFANYSCNDVSNGDEIISCINKIAKSCSER